MSRQSKTVYPLYSPDMGAGRCLSALPASPALTAEQQIAQLRDQLAESQKQASLGALASGIAHEINTPIQYVSDNVQFIGEALADIATLLGYIEKLEKQPEHTAELVADLVASAAAMDVDFLNSELPIAFDQARKGLGRIARITRAIKSFAHPGTEERHPTDINDCIRTTVTVATNQWKYVARMVLELSPDLPAVPVFAGPLQQVLLNLIVNAAQAIEETRTPGAPLNRISITSRHEADDVVIIISDNGPGIAPDIMQRVFEPFFTTKPPGKGTGQGLALVHEIITARHGGVITVSSSPGRGAVFTIRLPLAPDAPSTAHRPAEPPVETAPAGALVDGASPSCNLDEE